MVIVVFIHANGQGSKTEDFCQEIYSSGASSLSMKTISINVYQKHAVKGSCICVIATSHVKYVWYARELRFMITKFSRARARGVWKCAATLHFGHIHQISRNVWPVDRLKTKEHLLDFLILST